MLQRHLLQGPTLEGHQQPSQPRSAMEQSLPPLAPPTPKGNGWIQASEHRGLCLSCLVQYSPVQSCLVLSQRHVYS